MDDAGSIDDWIHGNPASLTKPSDCSKRKSDFIFRNSTYQIGEVILGEAHYLTLLTIEILPHHQ